MSNQLRRGIEILREHYIKRLLKSGLVNAHDHKLDTLTLSELEMIVRKTLPQKNNANLLQIKSFSKKCILVPNV